MDIQSAFEKDRLLWAYIDGLCLPAEKELVEARLQNDLSWKADYEALLAIHRDLADSVQLSAPSLRFTKNVMEKIGRYHIAPAMKTYVNKKIIYGIAGFFLLLLAVLIGYVLAGTNWSAVHWSDKNWQLSEKWMPSLSAKWLLNPNLVTGFFITNAVLALFLLDRYLSRQKNRTGWSDKVS
ncbi:MAG: hypothetical protein QM664_13260 [Flavihumibacter sp.]